MTLATENVFPTQSANLSINISENYFSSRTDENGVVHYYEFIPSNLINWLNAYNDVKLRTLNGLTGYLATITSQEEQDFIYNSIAKSGGWLGATRMRNNTTNTRINDEASLSTNINNFNYSLGIANDWYWATGPETGTVFFQGATKSTGTPVIGQYNNWTTASSEPNNNFQGAPEFVMQFAYSGSQWNDLPYNPNNYISGYYVEYGGYPGEQPTQDNAGYQVAIPDPVKVEYLDLANNSLFLTSYIFGNLGEGDVAPNAQAAPTGFSYLGLDSNSAPLTGAFQDVIVTVIHRYGQLFNVDFDLNYVTNNLAPATQAVEFGALATEPTIPQKNGYVFKGWNTASDGSGTSWNFKSTTMPVSNVTLYAQWEKKSRLMKRKIGTISIILLLFLSN